MKPKQFDFRREWNRSVKLIRNEPKVVEGLKHVAAQWVDNAEFEQDEMMEHDPVQAAAEFNLNLMIFRVKCWDLDWLREWTSPELGTLMRLTLGIAETLFPEQEWDRTDGADYEVVTNADRTIVFDIHNCDELPAGASLFLAKDHIYQPDDFDARAALRYLEEKNAKTVAALGRVRADIEFVDCQKRGNLVPFTRGSTDS